MRIDLYFPGSVDIGDHGHARACVIVTQCARLVNVSHDLVLLPVALALVAALRAVCAARRLEVSATVGRSAQRPPVPASRPYEDAAHTPRAPSLSLPRWPVMRTGRRLMRRP